MKKRIYKSMLFLALITIILTFLLMIGIIYREYYVLMKQEIRNEALFISAGYSQSGQALFSKLANIEDSDRITWVDSDGTVLFDNIAEADNMENHLSRPEIADALRSGSGEAVHLSGTLGTQTFYHAVRLRDGTALRVSATTNSVYKAVLDFIPYIALISLPVILLSMIIAGMLTKKIIVPLNGLNLEEPLSNDVYDELSPLLSRMAKQNDQIEGQMNKLREKQEEFRAITENIGEGIAVLDSKGHILSINGSASAIFGVSLPDSMGRHILTLNRSIPVQRTLEAAMEGQPHEDTFTKGSNTYNLLASPVKDGNRVSGIILLILDITEKYSAEKLRREFSANVSHELKTPLTSISGYAELMKNGMVKQEDIAVFSDRIYNEARNLISLIDDIIRISRLDENNTELFFEEVDLLELAQETADRIAPLAEQRNIALSVEGERAMVSGVRQILEEMLYNLCDNAVKYNYENGTVKVKVSASTGNVILSVADSGFGIPAEHQNRVFERFYRIDKSHSRDNGGTGLGLSIVKHSAQFHNAKLQLTSNPGRGTKVTVIFKGM